MEARQGGVGRGSVAGTELKNVILFIQIKAFELNLEFGSIGKICDILQLAKGFVHGGTVWIAGRTFRHGRDNKVGAIHQRQRETKQM